MVQELLIAMSAMVLCAGLDAGDLKKTKKRQNRQAPLAEVIVEDESSSIVASSASFSRSSSSLELPVNAKIKYCFEYLPRTQIQKILVLEMIGNPQEAYRLSYVCKAWNSLVNSEEITRTVIMSNPKYYAEHLVTAGCKAFNERPVPVVEEQMPDRSFNGVARALPVHDYNMRQKKHVIWDDDYYNALRSKGIQVFTSLTPGFAVGFIGSLGASNPFYLVAIPVNVVVSTVGFVGYAFYTQ